PRCRDGPRESLFLHSPSEKGSSPFSSAADMEKGYAPSSQRWYGPPLLRSSGLHPRAPSQRRTIMKAVVFHEIGDLRVDGVDDPMRRLLPLFTAAAAAA